MLDMNEIFDRRETILDFTKVQNYLAPFFFFLQNMLRRFILYVAEVKNYWRKNEIIFYKMQFLSFQFLVAFYFYRW